MKIKSVKWNNHPVLGNLHVDFTNPQTGKPSDTIVFAGENGTGKTSILEAISNFLNSGPFEPFEFIEYIVGSDNFKAAPTSDGTTYKPFYDIINSSSGQIEKIRADRNHNPNLVDSNIKDIRHYGFVLSKARADYKTQQITSTTTNDLDVEKYNNDSNDDFTSLKQLLVDIQNQDNSTYAELNQSLGATPQAWSDFYPSSKIFRSLESIENRCLFAASIAPEAAPSLFHFAVSPMNAIASFANSTEWFAVPPLFASVSRRLWMLALC